MALVELPLATIQHRFYDVNNDGFISPLDPLIIINFINSRSGGSAEGEYDKLAPSDAYFEELGKENRRRHGRRLG